MATFLTDEWFAIARDEAATLPARPGATASVQYVIAGAPSAKKLQFVTRFENGRLVEIGSGKAADVDCTVQLSYADTKAIFEGTLVRDVAFMRGDLKIDGDYGAYVLRLAPLFDSAEAHAVVQSTRARTEF